MKKLLLLLAVLTAFVGMRAESYTFDWSAPATLTPAFAAPTANNRYGEYISNVTFKSGPVELTIDDTSVKEQSQRARFLYGYLTETVEMRAYATSIIKIVVPQNVVIKSITFEGAKVTDEYLYYEGSHGQYAGSAWTAAEGLDVHQVDLEVLATINCTRTTVQLETASVDDIIADDTDDSHAEWYTATGVRLSSRPTVPGLYIVRTPDSTRKVAVR